MLISIVKTSDLKMITKG